MDIQKKGWSEKLQERWNVSARQVVIILIVFACTGTTVVLLKTPVLNYFLGEGDRSIIFSIIYLILILPIYNIFLLIYGFIFGQFKFFWEYEKKFFRKLKSRFY